MGCCHSDSVNGENAKKSSSDNSDLNSAINIDPTGGESDNEQQAMNNQNNPNTNANGANGNSNNNLHNIQTDGNNNKGNKKGNQNSNNHGNNLGNNNHSNHSNNNSNSNNNNNPSNNRNKNKNTGSDTDNTGSRSSKRKKVKNKRYNTNNINTSSSQTHSRNISNNDELESIKLQQRHSGVSIRIEAPQSGAGSQQSSADIPSGLPPSVSIGSDHGGRRNKHRAMDSDGNLSHISEDFDSRISNPSQKTTNTMQRLSDAAKHLKNFSDGVKDLVPPSVGYTSREPTQTHTTSEDSDTEEEDDGNLGGRSGPPINWGFNSERTESSLNRRSPISPGFSPNGRVRDSGRYSDRLLTPVINMDLVSNDSDDDMDDDDIRAERRIIKTPSNFLQGQSGPVENWLPPDLNRAASGNNSKWGRRTRQRRREGVMQPRSTLTFSKPPLSGVIELPQSPLFSKNNITFTLEKPTEDMKTNLRKNLLFTGVDQEYREKMIDEVIDMMVSADITKGETLIKQGDVGDAFYYIESGHFNITVKGFEDLKENDSKTDSVNNSNNSAKKPLHVKNINSLHKIRSMPKVPRKQHPHQRSQSRNSLLTSKNPNTKFPQFPDGNTVPQAPSPKGLMNSMNALSGMTGMSNINVITGHISLQNDTSSLDEQSDSKQSYDQKKRPISMLKMHSTGYESDDNEKGSHRTNEIIVAEAGPGATVGEYALLYNQLRTATLAATVDSKVWGITAEQFQDLRQQISDWNVMRFNQRQQFLSQIPLFSSLAQHEILNLTHACHAQMYESQDYILDEQRPNDQNLYIIVQGSVIVTKDSIENRNNDNISGEFELKLETSQDSRGAPKIGLMSQDPEYGKGDYFARRLFEADEKEAPIKHVVAETHCKILKIPRHDFNLIMASQGTHIQGAHSVLQADLPAVFGNRIDFGLDELRHIEILGVGSFGVVSLVKHDKTKKAYALKEVQKSKVVETGQEEHIINEKRVMAILESPFCVRLFATYQTDNSLYFLTDVVLGGELFTVLRFNEKFDVESTRFYAACVILAFQHIHSKDIIYRDLKPENLLLDNKGYLKLTDFGFAKKRNISCTLCGTPQYLAPEVIHNWVQSFAIDWWALGVLLYEMVDGHPPFEDDEHVKMYEKILVYDPEFSDNVPAKLRNLITKLLEKNAYQRLGSGPNGADDVKRHPFFKSFDWEKMFNKTLKAPYVPKISSDEDTSNYEHFENPFDDFVEDIIDNNAPSYVWTQDF